MKKIALIVHEIHPAQGSECASGWAFVKNIIKFIPRYYSLDIYIPETNIFRTANYYEEVINKLQITNSNINIICVKQNNRFLINILRYFQKKRKGVGLPILYYLLYAKWLKKTMQIINFNNYNIVHLLNHINLFTIPNFKSIPSSTRIVVGPMAGISKLPKDFYTMKELFRATIQELRLNWLKTKIQKISYAFAIGSDEQLFFNKFQIPCERMPEQCLQDKNPIYNKNSKKDCLNIIWIGELVYRKQLELLLHSLRRLEFKYKCIIIGSGPKLPRYLKLVKDFNLNCKFIGQISREQVMNHLAKSHVLVHTSIREGTATTIIEGLSFNNFIIAHRIGGHDLVLNQSNSYLIDLISRKYSIIEITRGLISYREDNMEYCEADSQFVFTYESASKKIARLYEEL